MDAVEFLDKVDRLSKRGFTEETMRYNDYRISGDNVGAVKLVERWAAEHPAKTRQSVFLKLFPGAEPTKDGVLAICPNAFSPVYKDERGLCKWPYAECGDCCRKFWLAEVEDV